MGIEAKQAYRKFLQSEKWGAIRLKRLVIDDARCALCGERSLHNDVHHIRYKMKWGKTRMCDLKTLCRRCHERVHEFLSQYKGKKPRWRDGDGNIRWRTLKNQIRLSHSRFSKSQHNKLFYCHPAVRPYLRIHLMALKRGLDVSLPCEVCGDLKTSFKVHFETPHWLCDEHDRSYRKLKNKKMRDLKVLRDLFFM